MFNLSKILLLWAFTMAIGNTENLFFTAEGEEDGKPLIFRSLHTVPEDSIESDYPYLISIFWQYTPANDSGMPSAESNTSQIAFETALDDLDKSGTSHLMLVVTGNGRKEWHWYVKDVEYWMDSFNTALTGQPVFPIEIENSYQPDWALYHNFIAGVKEL